MGTNLDANPQARVITALAATSALQRLAALPPDQPAGYRALTPHCESTQVTPDTLSDAERSPAPPSSSVSKNRTAPRTSRSPSATQSAAERLLLIKRSDAIHQTRQQAVYRPRCPQAHRGL
jgi:hypothetical protein